MKSNQQKQIDLFRKVITRILRKVDLGKLTVNDERAVEGAYKTLGEIERHGKRKVSRIYKGVSANQWKKWNADERETFNLINCLCRPLQHVINPATAEDKDDRLPKQLWQTIIHNVAFLTADEMRLIRKHQENPDKY